MSYREPPPPRDSLFGMNANPARLARRTDPATSHAAAVAIVPQLGDLQRQVLDIVRANPGKTRNELAGLMGWHPSEVSKRLPELEKARLVVRGAERACSVTGRWCATWGVV